MMRGMAKHRSNCTRNQRSSCNFNLSAIIIIQSVGYAVYSSLCLCILLWPTNSQAHHNSWPAIKWTLKCRARLIAC